MQTGILLTILAVQTVALGAVAVALLGVVKRVKSSAEELQALVRTTGPKLSETIEDIHRIVADSRPVGDDLASIGGDLKEIVRSGRKAAGRVVDTVDDTNQKARRQIERVDTILAGAVDKTEQATNLYADSILNSLAEVAALIRGCRVAVSFIRERHQAPRH